jgi:putative transposase
MADRCRAFKFLLQPTVRQRYALERLLVGQRELYNAALEERRGAWRWERRSVTRYEQYRTLTGLREVRPEILGFGVTVCRGTLARLDLAFAAFFRRVKAGQTPGFPRFRGPSRWDSVSWPEPQSWKVNEAQHHLFLQGVGHVKYRKNRPLRGTPKTITVRREGNRWFVTVFCVNVPAQPLPETGAVTGIDLGVVRLATLSDGTTIPNPRPGKRAAQRLAAAQRDLASRKRGSIRRGRAAERIGAVHRKVARQRMDHLHKVSRSLVERFDLIVHEDLKITNMTRRPAPRPDGKGGYEPNRAAQKSGLNRSILDAGWGTLLRLITYKAEDAGRQVIAADPRHTSDRCSQCSHTAKANRVSQAEFRCQACGHRADADHHAAGNILRAGLAQREAQARREAQDVA